MVTHMHSQTTLNIPHSFELNVSNAYNQLMWYYVTYQRMHVMWTVHRLNQYFQLNHDALIN